MQASPKLLKVEVISELDGGIMDIIELVKPGDYTTA